MISSSALLDFFIQVCVALKIFLPTKAFGNREGKWRGKLLPCISSDPYSTYSLCRVLSCFNSATCNAYEQLLYLLDVSFKEKTKIR